MQGAGLGQVGDPGGRAVGVHVADIGRVQPGILERGGDGDLGAAALGVQAAAGHGVAARAAAQDLAVDLAPRAQGVLALLQDHDPRPLARHPAVATAVERPARLRRLALPPRHVLEQAHPDQAQRVDLRVGAARDHHVGPSPADDPRRLGDGQVGRGVGLGDRVARPLAVDQDRDVAGEHVGQVLQEPDRLDHPDRLAAPDLEVETPCPFR